MSRRAATRLAYAVPAVSIAMVVVAALAPGRPKGAADLDFLFLLPLLAYAAVGALVATRRPKHPIGWLFSTVALALAISAMAIAGLAHYAHHAMLGPALLLLSSLGWIVGLGLALTFSLLLFPDGRLPSPRWRPVAWLAALSMAAGWAGEALGLGILTVPSELLPIVRDGGGLLLAMAVLVSAASLLVRYGRARGHERQQLKWFASATVVVAALIPLAVFVEGRVEEDALIVQVLDVLWPLAICTVPVAAGVAILRYRLYDIDLIIRRTLVYGALTAGLGLTYWGLVVLMQQVLRPFTEGSELAIIASTLAVAALFQPARRRIQDAVDRRFYRQKYDAQKTLEAFSTRLRQQTDLDSLGRELVGVVEQTVQPAHASLWLRKVRP